MQKNKTPGPIFYDNTAQVEDSKYAHKPIPAPPPGNQTYMNGLL